jgi:hypothetical protein
MPESLQELIAQWRKEARDIHELGRDNQDLIRCADELEAALAAVAPAGAEQVDESRSPDGDGRFDGGCRIPNKAARQVFGPAAKNPSIEH